MKPKSYIAQSTSTSQQYIRVDDEVEILVDKPVPHKIEGGQVSKVNTTPLLSRFKGENSTKCNPDPLEYADDCPEKNFKTPNAFYTPAQLMHKKRGNKNKTCILYNSVIEKTTIDTKKPVKLNLSTVNETNCKKVDPACDKPGLCNYVVGNDCEIKSVNLQKVQPSSGKKQWKKNQSFCFSETEKIVTNTGKVGLPTKISKSGLSKNVNKLEPISTFYNTQSDILVVNEADTPPFTPSMEITSCDVPDSSSCTSPEIVYLKTKPATRVSSAKMLEQKKKRIANKILQPDRVNKIKKALLSRSSALKVSGNKKSFGKREVNALFENLAEISWAQDRNFTSLLKDKDASRHRMSAIKTGIRSKTANLQKVSNEKKKKIKQKKIPTKQLTVTKTKPKNALSAFVKKRLKKSAKIALSKQNVHSRCKKSLQKKVAKPVVTSKLSSSQNKSKATCGLKPVVKKKKIDQNASEVPVNVEKSNKKDENVGSRPQPKATDVLLSSQSPFGELGMWGNLFQSPTSNFLSALPTARQELRVTLEPLERTDFWRPNCDLLESVPEAVEAYTKCSLQQRMLRVFTGIDQRHISSVLRDVPDSKTASAGNTKTSRKRKYDEESLRSSVRQSECAFRYKEIFVKKHENYIQIILMPKAATQNCLTVEGMKELKEAFLSAKKDSNCKAVLLNSSGSFFCSGIDLGQLHGSNKKHVAEEMAITIRDLILTLALFPKPVVAVVNGYAIGLGVTLLTLCDIIFSSDKATFCISSTKLGYIPEGGVLLTLPQVVGTTVAMEMLLRGRRLTADQALKYGLVSEVLWPTKLMEEAVPRIRQLVKQPLDIMESTKIMVRCHLWERLAVQLNHEWRMLPSQWLSSVCQQNIKQHLQTGWQMD